MLTEFGVRRTLIVAGLMLAVLLEIADTTIVNVALPTIQGNIGADLDQASWIVTGYLISVVIALPLVPWFESLLGRKRYVTIAILGFTTASVCCGLAQSVDALVAFRIAQGLFGGGILTSARSILRDTFPPAQLGWSQGLLAFGAVVGPSIGPTLGGVLTDAFSWRWCFFINVIPGLVAATLLFLVLRDPPRPRVSSDALGLALLVGMLAPLQYVLEEGERNDWLSDPGIATALAAGCVCGLAFVAWELFGARQPIVDLRILGRPAIRTGSLLSFATGFTLFVEIVLSPQFSQGILGFTATLSGNLVLVRAVSIIAFIPIAVIAMSRIKIPARFVIATGFAFVGLAGVLMAEATTPVSTFWTFGWALAVGGFGFGLIFVPVSTSVLSTVSGPDTSKASAMLSLSQQIGASVATAVLVTVIDHRESFHYAMLASDMTLNRIGVAAFLHAGGTLVTLSQMVGGQATSLAFADANTIGAMVAFAAALVALGLRPRRGATSPSAGP
jgi:MFS transporter, DHA2 family, multidrug resistance protein